MPFYGTNITPTVLKRHTMTTACRLDTVKLEELDQKLAATDIKTPRHPQGL